MTDPAQFPAADTPPEAALRRELAAGDRAVAAIAPVLSHLLANRDHALFSDQVLSRVRGMMANLARQLLMGDPASDDQAPATDLAAALIADAGLLGHCHALAIEWQLTEGLEQSAAIDPVLSPLLQALIASDEPATADLAMATLAAQARFVQHQRRMELPLAELPAEWFDRALKIARDCTDGDADGRWADLRARYDEGAGRLALLARLVHAMGRGASAALSIQHAGPAIFLTALAEASHQPRELAVLATNERQVARLVVSLRAAGLKPRAVEEQVLALHPDLPLPAGVSDLSADRALALLGSSHAGWPA